MAVEPAYVELHCHSAYSFLDGVAQPDQLVDRAVALGYQALALTDHDNLCAALPFAHAAKAAGLQPITGCELTVTDAGDVLHLVLLVENRRGYTNLCQLITAAHAATRADDGTLRQPPSVPLTVVLEQAEGLTCLSGCPQRGALAHPDLQRARQRRDQLLEAFTDRFVIELQRPFREGSEPQLRRFERLARERGIPLVATNNVHLHLRRRGPLQDVLVALREHATLAGSTAALRGNREHVLKSPAELHALFADLPQALNETLRIAERCSFDLTTNLDYQPPARTGDANAELARFCAAQIDSRYPPASPWRQEALQRLDTELALIQRHQLAGFFLLHHEILEIASTVAIEIRGTDAARSVLPPGRGRGSSVGSIVCYLTGLSHIDPVAGRLSLGRFLNQELASTPDIDLDFPRDIRAELIRRIHLHFGPQHAALVGAFSTYRARGAIKEIGKVLALPAGDIARLAAGSDGWCAETIGEELRQLPGLRERADDPRLRLLVTLCRQISGLPRHITQHPGGMIVSDRPLSELVPLQPAAMAGRTICQWDKDACADAGFLKIDLLGLGMLSAVERCVSEIYRSTGSSVDLSRVPLDDAGVYAEIQQADTVGVFQIESRAQMQTLLRVQPTCLDDLVVEVALVRPGPIQGGAVNPYIQRRIARRADPSVPIPYLHPLLEDPLQETLGVIIFQDQVLTVAEALAGFTPGQAETLRRAMSRRRSRAAIEAQWLAFAAGTAERGVPEHVARTVFEQIIAFSAFGFPKSHAAAFALLAYQSAWLRRHHPAAFLCALLMEQPMGFYPPASLIRDAEHRQVQVLPIDINQSHVEARCAGLRAVRLGLHQIVGLSAGEAEQIIEEREQHGSFRDVRNLANRLDLSTAQLQRLVAAGACDGFGVRRQLLWELGLATRPMGSPTGRQLAFELSLGEAPTTLPVPSAWELLVSDYATMGVSVRTHPIAQLRAGLSNTIDSRQLHELPHGTLLQLPGLAVARQRPGSAKGIVFLLLEDEYGLFNAVIMPDLYAQQRVLVRSEPLLLISGRLELRGACVSIRVARLSALGSSGIVATASIDAAALRSVAPAPQHFAQGRRRA